MFERAELSLKNLDDVNSELARRKFREFVRQTMPEYIFNWHHEHVIKKLQDFADGKIKYLIIILPTQTGKSELSTRRLPAYILGKDPDRKIAITSYSHTRASRFNRNVQQIIDTDEYREIFPQTRLNTQNVVSTAKGSHLRNSEIFEIVGHKGSLISTGTGGPLTGDPVDTLIMDDTVKGRADAMSITKQGTLNEWWDGTAKTRINKNGQILFVNTRWDEGDLIGYVLKKGEFEFEIVHFPALKVDDNDPDDPREIGDALWPLKKDEKWYNGQKKANPVVFEAVEQGNPGTPTEILVYPKAWKQINEMPGYSEFFGLDFGFSAPSALVRCMIKENKAYLEEKLYKTGLGIEELIAELKAAGVKGNDVYCDSAEPRTISDLRKGGINAVGANKDLIAGVLHMQSLEIYYTRGSDNLSLEKGKYQYPVGANNLPIPGANPVGKFNHLLDAARYGLYTRASQPVPSFDII